jgi:hypothetical protein
MRKDKHRLCKDNDHRHRLGKHKDRLHTDKYRMRKVIDRLRNDKYRRYDKDRLCRNKYRLLKGIDRPFRWGV